MINNYNKKYNYSILVLESRQETKHLVFKVKTFVNVRTNNWNYLLKRLKETESKYGHFGISYGLYNISSEFSHMAIYDEEKLRSSSIAFSDSLIEDSEYIIFDYLGFWYFWISSIVHTR